MSPHSNNDGEILEGGWGQEIPPVRRDEVVLRVPGEQSAFVHRLLTFLDHAVAAGQRHGVPPGLHRRRSDYGPIATAQAAQWRWSEFSISRYYRCMPHVRHKLSDASICLVADRPELVPQLAHIYWAEWGDEPGREALAFWIEAAASANQRNTIPVGFMAVDRHHRVLGGVALAESEEDLPGRNEWSPWLTGMIVRSDLRGQGVGHLLVAALDDWIRGAVIPTVWVLTGGRAVGFYKQCGWAFVETAAIGRETATILRKDSAAG